MLAKLTKLLRGGDRAKLEELSTEELDAARRDASTAEVEARHALERLEAGPPAGASEEEISTHVADLETARARVQVAAKNLAAIDGALRAARRREEEEAIAQDAVHLPAELRAQLDEVEEFEAAARVANLKLGRLADRLANDELRRRLAPEQLEGITARLLRHIPQSHRLAELVRRGMPIAVGAPKRKPELVQTPHGTYFKNLDAIETEAEFLAFVRELSPPGRHVVLPADCEASRQLHELEEKWRPRYPVAHQGRRGTLSRGIETSEDRDRLLEEGRRRREET